MVDWGMAIKIGGVGFLTVFVVLSVVALMLWLVGLIQTKSGAGDNGQKEGD